jgi:5'-3' exonuclease
MNDIFTEENNNMGDFNLDTRWIQEFESIDNNYKQFYNEVVGDVKICSIYVDKNNNIENIKQEILELSRENLITKEEIIKIIKQNSITQGKRYTLLSLLKYNIDLDASNVVHYLKQKQQSKTDAYLTLVNNIDNIPLNSTINMMQDLNTIFILFYEKHSTGNTTKKVYINNHSKTKKKQLKVS